MLRLNQANLANVPPTIPTPAYDRSKRQFTIAHIGVGGFHRAHQAVYLDDLLQQESGWLISGIGLLEQDRRIRDVLSSQDHLYTVVERSADSDKARIIGSIGEYLFAPEDRDLVIDRLAGPTTPIVSLTITENGYYVNQATGEFDDRHPDIQYDLAHPHEPKCSFGFIVEALDRQRLRGVRPFTLLSCDNLQGNGEVARKMILAFAELRDPTLRNWIESNVSFPNSMVDRITPATTDDDRAMVRDKFSIEDGWPVVCEPFRQWVIEDHFPAGRPAWEKVGAQITSDVLPYEKMKIRLLNAGHQALCYIGMLLGYKFAHEAMADDPIRRFVRRMMDVDVTPILPAVPGINLTNYKDSLIERFSNPAVKDTLLRLATEGSARVPKFVLPSIIEQLAQDGSISYLTFTVASWFRYLQGTSDIGKELPINDPRSAELQKRARAGKEDPTVLLQLGELFSEKLTNSERFLKELRDMLRRFYADGSRKTLHHVLEED